MLMALGGVDAVVFTGGIGENGKGIRRAVCEGLTDLGIRLSPTRNESGDAETPHRRYDRQTYSFGSCLPTKSWWLLA